jgi:DNA-binding NtrC family response regulator
MKQKHRILIVDDDADDREIIRDAFMSAMEEQEFVFIENGDRLLEYLEKKGRYRNTVTDHAGFKYARQGWPGNTERN